jgi:MFS family permease
MARSDQRLLTPRFVLVVAVGLAYFLSIGMLLPVVPLFVKHHLAGGDLAVGVAVGAFAVGAVLLRPYAGRIGDRFGRRVLIVGGALVVAASAGLYLIAHSLVLLVLVRILGGVGEAAFFVGAGTMITDLAPEDRRGEAISYWSVAVYGGLAFGPTLGESLLGTDRFSSVWVVAAGLALVAAMLGLLTTETARAWSPPAPGTPDPPLLHRAALAPGAVLFLGLVGLAGFVSFVPLYVSQIGMADSRGVFLLYGCLILAVRILGARLPDRLGSLRAGTAATGLAAAGLMVMAAFASPLGLYAGTAVFSIGMSLLYPSLLTLALTGVPETERASAVGTVSSFFDASQGLGALILGGVAALAGYRGAFVAGAVLALAGMVMLRSGVGARARGPADAVAAAAARESLEPDPP